MRGLRGGTVESPESRGEARALLGLYPRAHFGPSGRRVCLRSLHARLPIDRLLAKGWAIDRNTLLLGRGSCASVNGLDVVEFREECPSGGSWFLVNNWIGLARAGEVRGNLVRHIRKFRRATQTNENGNEAHSARALGFDHGIVGLDQLPQLPTPPFPLPRLLICGIAVGQLKGRVGGPHKPPATAFLVDYGEAFEDVLEVVAR